MTLGLDSARDAILQMPKSEPNSNFPLLVFFHGEGMAPVKARTRCLTISARRPKKRVSQCWLPRESADFADFTDSKRESVQEPHRIKVAFNGFESV